MARERTEAYYEKKLKDTIIARYGEYDAAKYDLLVEEAASDLHLKYQIKKKLNELQGEFVEVVVGSQGQSKMEVTPLLDKYNQMSRTCQSALDALMISPGSTFKKVENKTTNKKEDPMNSYFSQLK